MACFERNLHTLISGRDSIQSTTFSGDHIVDTTFLFYDPLSDYDTTIGNDVARNVYCDIYGTYHNVTMYTDVARTLIYYVLLCPIIYNISVFLLKSLKFYIKH